MQEPTFDTLNTVLAEELGDRIARLSPAKRALLEMRLKRKNPNASDEPTIPRRAKDAVCPLSFSQQRLWFLHQFDPESTVYNMMRALCLRGTLNVAALQKALDAIVARHEILRTKIVSVDGTLVQVFAERALVELPLIDVSERSELDRQNEVQHFLKSEGRRPFNLASDLLLRATLLRLGEEEHLLVLTTHHIASDGWSAGILSRELATLYGTFSGSDASALHELPIQYADFALWQRQSLQGERLQSQLSYWKERLAGAPALLELPTDRPRPTVQSFRGSRRAVSLTNELTDALKAISKREGVTLFMTLLAAFKTLLSRYTSQHDILIGVPVANRTLPEMEKLIGFFVNNLVLRTDLSGNPTFQELLARVREVSLGAYAHEDLPFEKLVEELQPERSLSHTPLFQVMFGFQNIPPQPIELPGLTVNSIAVESGTSKFDLFLSMVEETDFLRGWLEYNTDVFDDATIARMLGHFQALLESIVSDPEQRVSDLSMLSEAEREQLLVDWNATQAEYPECCVHELFEAQAERTPDAVAVIGEGERLTYRELEERAERLAGQLRAVGVKAGMLVGICLERSVDLVVGLLGILKSGGAYVPIDPAYPVERKALMIEDGAMAVVLTHERLRGNLPQSRCRVVSLEQLALEGEAHGSEETKESAGPDNLTYVIYTSGSTGKPKGVEIQHRALVNFLHSMRQKPGLTPQDVLLSVTTISFDIAGLELFLPLVVGACVVIVGREVALDGRRLMEQLESSGATVMQATPATWRMLIDIGWSGRKELKILCGGEALSEELASQLLERGASLWNLYGPTESTIWSTVYWIEAVDGAVPIGRPIANTEIYILDPYLNPVPVGVPGELYIGGAGLARGYRNRPELVAERFIPNPFSSDPGVRIYKTGDLARYRADGNIEFLGRIDHQVKLRGFRIELAEVESVLSQHAGVRESVVVVREDEPGDKRLVAYIVPKRDLIPGVSELRDFLKSKLPDYMVPSAFVELDALPLTPNGKVDRKALPAPDQNRSELEASYVAPRDAIEVQLTRIWEKALGREPIGGRDNFFELGGHSLLAVQVMHQIREVFRQTLPVKALFQAPTVEQLAEVLREQDPLRDWASLVPLQSNGSKPPFFFLAGRSHFGDRLGSDQPVYRVVYQDLDREQPFVRIEDMASHSIESVRKIQPDGPYYLGGHSPGGIVAFEMAQQLQRQGQKVALLAICECWRRHSASPTGGKSRIHRLWQKANYHFHRTRRVGTRQQLTHLLMSLTNKTRGSAGRKQSVPLTRSQKEARAAVFEARRGYVPQAYSGRLTLIRCSERPAWRDYDPLDGWGSLATDGVEVYEVPGRHAEIYREPNVGMLAQTLSDVLYRAQAEMESERTALIDHKLPLIDSRLFGDTQSGRTEGKNHRQDSQSLSELSVGDN